MRKNTRSSLHPHSNADIVANPTLYNSPHHSVHRLTVFDPIRSAYAVCLLSISIANAAGAGASVFLAAMGRDGDESVRDSYCRRAGVLFVLGC